MTQTEALRLALEALTVLLDEWTPARQAQLKGMEAVTAIKASLEAKDEPVALVVYRGEICYKSTDDDQSFAIWCPVNYDSKHEFADGTKFYTTPPQRKPLTDEEVADIERNSITRRQAIRAIEAKLKEKNT
jgi:hypothetical protein